EHAFVVPNLLLSRRAGPHLDATNAGADAAVGGYQGDANLTAPFDVSAAAEFPRPVAEGDDANPLAVLLVEERHRPGRDRLLERKLLDAADQVGADLLVQQGGDAVDLLGRQRARKTKVEGGVVGLHRGAGLDRLLAEDVPQCPVQQVCRRMMPRDGLASRLIHRGVHTVAGLQLVGPDLDAMPDRLALRLRIDDPSPRLIPSPPAG